MEGVPAVASRGRRRRPRKGDLKEEAILNSAERLLSEKALSDISIDELARGADISRPAFYFYFGSKDAVLQALVERIADEAYRASEKWISGTEDPEEAIREAIAAGAKLWRDRGPVLRAAVQTWEMDPLVHPFWEQVVNGFIEASAERIRRDRRAGTAPPGPRSPKALATALIWMNERCFYTNSLGLGPSLSDRELTDTLTTVWMRAVYCSDSPGDVPAGAAGEGEATPATA
jgi:AcrR family transcriptional regulator